MNWNQIVRCLSQAAARAMGNAPDGFVSRTMVRVKADQGARTADVHAAPSASSDGSPLPPGPQGSSDVTIERRR